MLGVLGGRYECRSVVWPSVHELTVRSFKVHQMNADLTTITHLNTILTSSTPRAFDLFALYRCSAPRSCFGLDQPRHQIKAVPVWL